MHKTTYRRRRISFLSIILLGLGIYFLLRFTWFDVRFVPILVSIVFLLFVLPAILSSRRHRTTHRSVQERKQYEIYTPTPSPYKPVHSYERTDESTNYSNRQEFMPTVNNIQPATSVRPNFCNFCGAKIVDDGKYCINCGLDLN
ncbi:MAG: zinc ribbon domain-containing protein [Asgard group archaeon]|nr:zinc ribbon domain-containing protein [Asgard group archaeon]